MSENYPPPYVEIIGDETRIEHFNIYSSEARVTVNEIKKKKKKWKIRKEIDAVRLINLNHCRSYSRIN